MHGLILFPGHAEHFQWLEFSMFIADTTKRFPYHFNIYRNATSAITVSGMNTEKPKQSVHYYKIASEGLTNKTTGEREEVSLYPL